ncbi:MAG: MCP four helix bundle domain-containing protein [Bryobacteraceae bacterium]|nr:MCP four helix bundle domain-containing protein [Bryobacteraceae bacterium]
MTVGKKLTISFAGMALMMAVLGTVALLSLSRLGGAVDSIVSDSLPGLFVASKLGTMGRDHRALMLTHSSISITPAEKSALESDIDRIDREFRGALQGYEKTMTQQKDRELYARVVAAHDRVGEMWREVRPVLQAGTPEQNYSVWTTRMLPIARERAQLLDELATLNKAGGDANAAGATAAASTAKVWLFVTFGLSLVFALGLAFWNIRSINHALLTAISKLRDGASQVASASRQVAASSQTLAQGSSEQAASVQETSASTEEITAMARKNADHSSHASDEVDAVSRSINGANENLERMVAQMSGIETASSKMARIMKVIDEIAFQTNILALNAAVEAARAGDAGMGFAVVAGEVRTLAQRSAESARDTSQLIEESMATSKAGSAQLRMLGESITGITEHSIKLKDLVNEVTNASQEQARGASEIASALAQMDSATQSVASNAEEGAAASLLLSEQADSLIRVIVDLEQLVRAS